MGDIFGIGIEELIFIGILLALLFGPESLPKIARAAGKALNQLFRSPLYREGQQIRKQIQDLPTALARLAELEELQKSLNTEISGLKAAIEPGTDKVAESIAAIKREAQDLAAPGKPSAMPAQPGVSDPAKSDSDELSENTIAPPSTPAQSTQPGDTYDDA